MNFKLCQMLLNPVNRAIVGFVRANPNCTVADVRNHLATLGLEPRTQVNNLIAKAVLINTKPRAWRAHLKLGLRAELFDTPLANLVPKPKPKPEPKPEPAPTRWVGEKALPPQYDVMHAPVWVPPVSVPARPGAGDFLGCPTRGHRC